jgi:hypothetical protein
MNAGNGRRLEHCSRHEGVVAFFLETHSFLPLFLIIHAGVVFVRSVVVARFVLSIDQVVWLKVVCSSTISNVQTCTEHILYVLRVFLRAI